MSSVEILSLIVTALCLISFCLVFTFLFRHYYLSNIEEINKGNADQEILDLEKEEIKKKTRKHAKAIRITKKVASYGIFAIVLVIFGFSFYLLEIVVLLLFLLVVCQKEMKTMIIYFQIT